MTEEQLRAKGYDGLEILYRTPGGGVVYRDSQGLRTTYLPREEQE